MKWLQVKIFWSIKQMYFCYWNFFTS